MIVKCEQCQTRFKIPDDKVTEKGVKVRCTKCSHTFRVTRDMAQAATTAVVPALRAPPAGADPFARFGALPDTTASEVTAPGVFSLGVEASKSPELSVKKPPSPPGVPFDFGSLSPPATGAPPLPPMSVPAPAVAPFDFGAIARPAPPTAGAAPAAFDFSNFAAVSQAMPPPPPPPVRPAAAPAAQTPAFDFSAPMTAQSPALPAFDFSQVAPPAVAAAPSRSQSSAPVDEGGMTDQVPAFSASADGFFAGALDMPPPPSNLDGAAARAMFDLPPAAPAPSPLLDLPAPEPEADGGSVERVALARLSGPQAPVAPVAPAALEPPPRRRTVVAIVVNVAIAAVLVLGLVVVGSTYLNEGKLSREALSLESLKNTFAPPVDFVANDVSNGLYETRAGRSVFFVRGEVMNRGEAAVKVVVKAEIVEDGKVVRFGESWAGEPATPEEIFLIDSAESLEALNLRVEKRALVVPGGAAAAFVVAFTEYPPDLKDFRVRVSARAVVINPTAANP